MIPERKSQETRYSPVPFDSGAAAKTKTRVPIRPGVAQNVSRAPTEHGARRRLRVGGTKDQFRKASTVTKPISIQLYSVREEMKHDVWGTLGKIADMGYPAIEPFNIPGGDVSEAARRISGLGLTVSSYQGGIPVGDQRERLLDETEALGTTRIVCPSYNREKFTSTDGLKEIRDVFAEAIDNCAERGLTFGYHNHEFELESIVDGKPALLQLAAMLPQLRFTVDTYWVVVGKQSAVEVVNELGPQANLLHIKDGPLNRTEPMTAVGAGKMDFAPIVAAADAAEWLVVELDRCDGDMMTAVGESLRYLADSGLGTTSLA